MPSVSDVVLFPFKVISYPLKIVAKPFVWWRYGYERKVDEYKVEITYNVEFDNKPLTITRAINCEIFEGNFRWASDGIKRPSRRVVESVRQVTYKIPETGEILILPIPGYCQVDKPFKEEKVTSKNGKTKVKIIPIKNRTKSFSKLSDKVIQSPAIVRFNKDNPKEIDYIERIISPKLYESKHVRIKIKSFSFRIESKEKSIDTQLVVPKIENRFAWINGESKSDKLPRWGTYLEEDKGAYAAFGMFKYPKEIWSKIPTINAFIVKILEQEKSAKDQKDFLYISSENQHYQKLGVKKVLDDAKRYLVGQQSYNSLDKYFGGLGINEIDTSIARVMTIGTDIMKKEKSSKWVVNEEKEVEWRKLVRKTNYRDYYSPFIFNEKERAWEEAEGKKGLLIINKVQDAELINIRKSAYDVNMYVWNSEYKFCGNIFENKTGMIALIYDVITKELILFSSDSATYLK